MVVGMIKDETFEEQTIQLEPGDILVAFSDGITEARDLDGEEFGEERVLACVNAHRGTAAVCPVANALRGSPRLQRRWHRPTISPSWSSPTPAQEFKRRR